ncbi:polymorphic toxin type 8 domain-containing protein [Variovorax sp. KK3]
MLGGGGTGTRGTPLPPRPASPAVSPAPQIPSPVAGELMCRPATAGGRAGKQSRLRELASDDKLGSGDRGWLEQELNSIARGQRDTLRVPPGKELAHERGREAAKGYGYDHSNLQDRELHRLQHRYDDWGRSNRERPPE